MLNMGLNMGPDMPVQSHTHCISYHALQSSYCTTESNLLNYQRVSGMSGRMTMMTMIHQAISWDDYNVRNMGWMCSPKGSPMAG